VVEGKKVIEVRLRGVSKMAAANHAMATLPALGRILAVGDDRTDEDMFAALPEPFVTVKVGGGPTAARYRIADPSAVRRVLASLVVSAPEAETRPS
jgi:trehalose 6-phosphate synthase/phosphatase